MGPLGRGDLAKLRVGPIAPSSIGLDGGCEQLAAWLATAHLPPVMRYPHRSGGAVHESRCYADPSEDSPTRSQVEPFTAKE